MRRKAPLLWIRTRMKGRSAWMAMDRTAALFTAVATVALAGVTLYLVTVTRAVANETRAAALAAVRPQLADVPPGAGPGKITYSRLELPKTFTLRDKADFDVEAWRYGYDGRPIVARSVAVRNIGNGPARVRLVRVHFEGRSVVGGVRSLSGWSVPSIIPAGGSARLMAVESGSSGQPLNRSAVTGAEPFEFEAEYTDIEGNQCERVTIDVRQPFIRSGQLAQVGLDLGGCS